MRKPSDLSNPRAQSASALDYLCGEAESQARDGFLIYASCSSGDQGKLQYFRVEHPKALVIAKDTDITDLEATGVPECDVLEDHPDFVAVNLYRALSTYSGCDCSLTDTSGRCASQHDARLCLTYGPSVPGYAIYDLHFLSSPGLPPDQPFGHWQQLRLKVQRFVIA